jgi:hypothetical protein
MYGDEQATSPSAVIVDSIVLISICSKETSHSTAAQALADRAAKGSVFLCAWRNCSRVLFVVCRKLSDGTLSTIAHDEAIRDIEGPSVRYASRHRMGSAAHGPTSKRDSDRYSCLHSADCLYVALAEELTASSRAEFLTFDNESLTWPPERGDGEC